MPVWYREEPDENGEAVEIFRGTVWEMANRLDETQCDLAELTERIEELVRICEEKDAEIERLRAIVDKLLAAATGPVTKTSQMMNTMDLEYCLRVLWLCREAAEAAKED